MPYGTRAIASLSLSITPGVDKGRQPLIFNPALTTCASERMKTQRFFVLCGFCRPGANARGKTRKTQKSGIQPLF